MAKHLLKSSLSSLGTLHHNAVNPCDSIPTTLPELTSRSTYPLFTFQPLPADAPNLRDHSRHNGLGEFLLQKCPKSGILKRIRTDNPGPLADVQKIGRCSSIDR